MASAAARQSTSFAGPLALAYAALVVYASLFPFEHWRWPPGQALISLLALPWPPWKDPFDLWANLLGYVPWGLLLIVALLGAGRRLWQAWALALLLTAAMSYLTEVTQIFLPNRHPSLKDVAMNLLGAGVGALAGTCLHLWGVTGRWHLLKRRWLVPRSGGPLALLALWPAGLMFPTPLPLGLGQVGDRLRQGLDALLQDVPWAVPLHTLVTASTPATEALKPTSEGLATTLGLLAPCMLAHSIARSGWVRVALTLGLLACGAGGMTLSTLLNYGPHNAMAWMTPATPYALLAATVAGVALAAVPRRVAAGIGLLALAAGVALVAQAPPNPYFAQSLMSWEQGRFVHFHGIVQWIGLLWPYAAMAALLAQLGRREG